MGLQSPCPSPPPELWGDTTPEDSAQGVGCGPRGASSSRIAPTSTPQAVGFCSPIPSFAKDSKRTELVPCPGLVIERNRGPRTSGK